MSLHPLLRHLPRYEPPSLNGAMPPFQYAQFADYLSQVFCLERVRHFKDHALGFDGPATFAKTVLLYDCVTEVYWAQRLTNWDGYKQFELLNRKRDGVQEDEPYQEAEKFVQGILGMSSTMKVSHGLKTRGREYLAELWDKPENKDADRVDGTFAAYLRWASVHFQQTKNLTPVKMPSLSKALLEGDILSKEGEPRDELQGHEAWVQAAVYQGIHKRRI